MADISASIKSIEAATSGSAIRTEVVNALNALNNDIDKSKDDNKDTYDSISVDKVNEICTR